jgi:hypothetical protein
MMAEWRSTMRVRSYVLAAAVASAPALLGAVVVGVACSHGRSGASAPPGGLSQLEQDTGVQWTAVPGTYRVVIRDGVPAAW